MQTNRSSPQRRAADLATRDRAVVQEIQKEQQEREKKTARLRDLRCRQGNFGEGRDRASAGCTTGSTAVIIRQKMSASRVKI